MSKEKRDPGTWWWFGGNEDRNKCYLIAFFVGYDPQGNEIWQDEDGDTGDGCSYNITEREPLHEIYNNKDGFKYVFVLPDLRQLSHRYRHRYRHLTPHRFAVPVLGECWIEGEGVGMGVVNDMTVMDLPTGKRWIVEEIPEQLQEEIREQYVDPTEAWAQETVDTAESTVTSVAVYTYLKVNRLGEPLEVFLSHEPITGCDSFRYVVLKVDNYDVSEAKMLPVD